MKPIKEHTDEQLKNVIDNHRRLGRTDTEYYREALAELDLRKGGGLNFEKSMELIREGVRSAAMAYCGGWGRRSFRYRG